MMTVNAYLRRIGTRLCATFDDERFYMSECEETDEAFLRDAGVIEADLPKEVKLPEKYYFSTVIVDG